MVSSTRQSFLRLAFAWVPVLLAVLHVVGVVRLGALEWVDSLIYDTRLRATMPQTMDPRIVIVDVDEKSLSEVGQWPWPRHRLARITDELFDRQRVAVLGFDVVFAEPDATSPRHALEGLAARELAHLPALAEQVRQLTVQLDHDQLFAKALANRPVVLGHYFTSDRDGRKSGQLPPPAMSKADLQGKGGGFVRWTGYGANIPELAAAVRSGGYFNAITDSDGLVRAVPLVSQYGGEYFQSLALAVFRELMGSTTLAPGFPPSRFLPTGYQGLESIVVQQGDRSLPLPVDQRVSSLVPYRGLGGPKGGSFQYVSAADVLHGRLAPEALKGKVVLFGTTAPGLLDLRATPVGTAYPGVEVHANLISGFLDGNVPTTPDYALGYELVVVLVSGLLLALLLPRLPAARAIGLSLGMLLAVTGLNLWLYTSHGLALPLASALFMIVAAFVMNMSHGYFAESRSKRELAQLFGTYVPPELVDEMVKDPDSYTMQARARELTVVFCDMRGFTRLAETMTPEQLQTVLNQIFSRMTEVIRRYRGTIDKYMGDCVMAFWGAPLASPDHAAQAVQAALEMTEAMRDINASFRARGWPEVGVGIGINTGSMLVGDMGSNIRRSYTVIGDAVNLGSRLEALSRVYGVDVVAGEATRRQAPQFHWQELGRVVVKGRAEAVRAYTPLGVRTEVPNPDLQQELAVWDGFLKAYRAQDWEKCDIHLLNLQRMRPASALYAYYANCVAQQRVLPPDPAWDGTLRPTDK
ncbi:MAG: adenylate/guanylate cyclase domain-containing protein [Polaromonas sp.]|nr:adenylate/guanylate cyclase domain-containing protein [Polaromonas sp.]